MRFSQISCTVIMIILFFAAIIQPVLALTEGSSVGTAHVGVTPPTVNDPLLWDVGKTTLKNATALSVNTEYLADFTVVDNNGLGSLKNITIKMWDSITSTENAVDAESNHYTFTWVESTDTWASSPAGFIFPADCVSPGSGSTLVTFEFTLAFDLSKVAKNTAANTDWKIKIIAVDDSEDVASNSELMFGVALYREITVSDATHGWSSLHPGDVDQQIDIPGDGRIHFRIVSNDNWLIQGKGSGPLTSGSNTIPLSDVKIDKDTLATAIPLTTSYENIPGLTTNPPPSTETGVSSQCVPWITVPLGTPSGDYTYTLSLQILQQV